MPGWVAVAALPSYRIRRIMAKWAREVPRAVLPNSQRTIRSYFAAATLQPFTPPVRVIQEGPPFCDHAVISFGSSHTRAPPVITRRHYTDVPHLYIA